MSYLTVYCLLLHPQCIRSFLMGQRTALEYAFAEALPSRQALGAVQGSLGELRAAMSQTSASARGPQPSARGVARSGTGRRTRRRAQVSELQGGAVEVRCLAQQVEAKIRDLEQARVPALEVALAEAITSLSSGP